MEKYDLLTPEPSNRKRLMKEDREDTTYWVNWAMIAFCFIYHLYYLIRIEFMWVLFLVEVPGLLLIFWNITVLTDLGSARRVSVKINWLLITFMSFYALFLLAIIGVMIFVALPSTQERVGAALIQLIMILLSYFLMLFVTQMAQLIVFEIFIVDLKKGRIDY